MTHYILIVGLFFLAACHVTGNKSDAFWEGLLLNTGYLEDINDLTACQKQFLETIKTDYKRIEKNSLVYSKEVFDDWYQEDCLMSKLEVSGLILPEDNSKIWELYVESFEEDKYLIVVVIFEGENIKDFTVID